MSTRPFRIVSIVGTRPNFMKVAPIAHALSRRNGAFEHVLVHTGQHYDECMSQVFLEQLRLGDPDHYLGAGSGTHAQQTARVMERLHPLLIELAPDFVFVVGDVNSTMAAALAATQLQLPIGHVEAGLRSFDRTMPEEINRIVTDAVSNLLFTHSPEAADNLIREGAREESIHYVGNTMIDTLVELRDEIKATQMCDRMRLDRGNHLMVTLHRPALVDGELLAEAIAALGDVAAELPVVFPVHPRTRAALSRMQIKPTVPELRLVEPLGYVEFLSLVCDSAAVVTDSGGIQEETTFLGIPCFTLRNRTERPVTVELGTNRLLGLAPERIREIPELLRKDGARRDVPPLWDGHAAERVVQAVERALASERYSSLVSGILTGS